jgi:hypothetical protein
MSKLSDPHLHFQITSTVVEQSLEFFRQQGRRGHEGVVLWPATLSESAAIITSPLIPRQITSRLSFTIPHEENFRILEELNRRRMVVPIQIHSHPQEAFHSEADDEYAFIKHEGAISIVIPYFADFPDRDFLHHAVFFSLSERGIWELLPSNVVAARFTFDHHV